MIFYEKMWVYGFCHPEQSGPAQPCCAGDADPGSRYITKHAPTARHIYLGPGSVAGMTNGILSQNHIANGQIILLAYKKPPQMRWFFSFFSRSINENRIRRPVLGTFELDMEHLQTMEHEHMLL